MQVPTDGQGFGCRLDWTEFQGTRINDPTLQYRQNSMPVCSALQACQYALSSRACFDTPPPIPCRLVHGDLTGTGLFWRRQISRGPPCQL